MDMLTKLYAPEPTLSCEYFPPKSPAGWGTLYATLAAAQELNLDFASVTYGAGGSTRRKTLSLVERLQNELTIDAMAHLTCVGHSRDELDGILSQMKEDNIPAVMALRGDPPKGSTHFEPHPDGFNYANELIEFIRDRYDFKIGCASYPEGHLESANAQQDIGFLKLKQDCGADFTVTQLFFDNEDFYRFRDAARAAGVTMPILAGIMPVTAVKQLSRFQSLCGCSIPSKLSTLLTADSETSIVERGIAYGVEQVQDLLDNGIEGIHLYTLNKSYSSAAIIAELHKRGYYKTD